MPNIMCQEMEWGKSSFFPVFVAEDKEHDPVDAPVVIENPHGSGPSSDFSEIFVQWRWCYGGPLSARG